MKSLFKNKLSGGVGRTVAGQAASYATRQYVGENKAIDVRLGMALLKDRRVAVKTKLMALVVGLGAIMLLDTLEIPLEMLVALLLPVVGFGLNLVADGAEFILGSLLIAAAVAPRLAPKDLVARIRAEREPQPVLVHAHR